MRDVQHRAAEARRLLGEPLLNEALDKMERDAFEEMLDGKPGAERVRVIRGIREHLKSIILTGESAARPPPAVV